MQPDFDGALVVAGAPFAASAVQNGGQLKLVKPQSTAGADVFGAAAVDFNVGLSHPDSPVPAMRPVAPQHREAACASVAAETQLTIRTLRVGFACLAEF